MRRCAIVPSPNTTTSSNQRYSAKSSATRAQVSYIPEDQVKTYLNGYVPAIQEWLIADCGATTEEEDEDLDRLIAKIVRKEMQPSERRHLDLLSEKQRNISKCEYTKLFRERMRLAKESPL
jgi:hypothetical protein